MNVKKKKGFTVRLVRFTLVGRRNRIVFIIHDHSPRIIDIFYINNSLLSSNYNLM